MNKISLYNWSFSLKSVVGEIPENITNECKYPAQVPGCIHLDLLNNKIIDDPFFEKNENDLEWIDLQDWIYETEFDKPEESNSPYYLVCEGLDTVADIFLNEVKIAETANMFLKHEIKIDEQLILEKNKLKIIFNSAINHGKGLEQQFGKLPVALASERVYLRKAQYSFGWDWGPSFVTSGIWKDIYITQKKSCKVADIKFTTLACNNDKADIRLEFNLEGDLSILESIPIKITAPDGKEIITNKKVFENYNLLNIEITNPKLWFPNGLGEACLYNLSIEIKGKDDSLLDQFSKKVGIRTIELVQKDNSGDSKFQFRVNGKDIYSKGYNWIPADSFLPRISDDKYRNLLNMAKDSHCNMIRVWGGGIYEKDIFYEICDELGLMVWQDFMFACAVYPTHNSYLKSVEDEVKQNVERLRLHPAIVLWCGNNENEWIWTQQNEAPIDKMPDYKIYHDLIPNILKEFDPSRPYWPSSPFGYEDDPNDFESGNTHQWYIWSMWKDYTEVKNDESKFVSEFGFQGSANKETFEKYLSEDNRSIQNEVFEHHNKQIEGPERIFRFLSAHLPIKTEWDDFLYLTQLNQGFALKTCLEHWRTNRTTNGSLIWQLNDCWPVCSWATIDSELKPKMAYHFVKRAFEPIILSFKEKENGEISCAVQNQSMKDEKIKIQILLLKTKTDDIIEDISKVVEIISGATESFQLFRSIKKDYSLVGSIYDSNNNLIYRNYYSHVPWKHVKMNAALIQIENINTETNKITVKAARTSWFVDLYHHGVTFDDRGFIMLKGETREVSFRFCTEEKLELKQLKIYTLNDYLN